MFSSSTVCIVASPSMATDCIQACSTVYIIDSGISGVHYGLIINSTPMIFVVNCVPYDLDRQQNSVHNVKIFQPYTLWLGSSTIVHFVMWMVRHLQAGSPLALILCSPILSADKGTITDKDKILKCWPRFIVCTLWRLKLLGCYSILFVVIELSLYYVDSSILVYVYIQMFLNTRKIQWSYTCWGNRTLTDSQFWRTQETESHHIRGLEAHTHWQPQPYHHVGEYEDTGGGAQMVWKRSEGGNTHSGLKTFTQQRRRAIQTTPDLE